MTDKQQKANIVCCETCSHREVCYEVITNTDYDFKGYGCLRYCVSPLVISNNARKEMAKEILQKMYNIYAELLIKGSKSFSLELMGIPILKRLAKDYGVQIKTYGVEVEYNGN